MSEQARPSPMVDIELDLPLARIQRQIEQSKVGDQKFHCEDAYWIDMCLTPRRPPAFARYIDHWGSHRFSELGSIIALPPGEQVHINSAGGRHASLTCQLRAEAVNRWFPSEFEWTDRRLEACLHIASDSIRWLLLHLYEELRSPGLAARHVCEASVELLSLEMARYIVSVSEPVEKGGLASWRLRAIDARLAEPRQPPTVSELAQLCKVSVRQLTRGFRASRGCTMKTHLDHVRIDAAKRRLAGGESINGIAEALGFASQSGFTYAFRRATGITPAQYRKSLGSRNLQHTVLRPSP